MAENTGNQFGIGDLLGPMLLSLLAGSVESGGDPFGTKPERQVQKKIPSELEDVVARLKVRLLLNRLQGPAFPRFAQFAKGAAIPQARDPQLEAEAFGVAGRKGTTTSQTNTRTRPAAGSAFENWMSVFLLPAILNAQSGKASGNSMLGEILKAAGLGQQQVPQPLLLNDLGISSNVAPYTPPDFSQTPASDFTFEAMPSQSSVPDLLQAYLGQNWGWG